MSYVKKKTSSTHLAASFSTQQLPSGHKTTLHSNVATITGKKNFGQPELNREPLIREKTAYTDNTSYT